MKKVHAHNCNFHEAFMPWIEYQHADFTGSSFCDCVTRMGGRVGHGAKIDWVQIEKWGLILNGKENTNVDKREDCCVAGREEKN